MSTIDRLEQIQELLKKDNRITLLDISEKFNISIATARRDLDLLAEHGKVQRIRGGAILVGKAPPELPVLQRAQEQTEEKQRIGAAAAALVHEGDSVFIGNGSTAFEVAKNLTKLKNITVITNSLLVQNALANYLDISLVIMGGYFRNTEYAVYGHITEYDLSQVHVNKVIIGIRAINIEEGLSNDFLFFPEVSTDRAIIKSGKEVIIVADHTKFNRISTAIISPISCVNKIITDNKVPPDTLNEFRDLGIDVIVA